MAKPVTVERTPMPASDHPEPGLPGIKYSIFLKKNAKFGENVLTNQD
jgi:hypothetical protein